MYKRCAGGSEGGEMFLVNIFNYVPHILTFNHSKRRGFVLVSLWPHCGGPETIGAYSGRSK